MTKLRTFLQILLPILAIAAGVAVASFLANRARPPIVVPPPARGPLVRTATVERLDLRIDVDTQGTVEPFRTVELASQVGGRITAASPQLRAGGFFAADEVLVSIDPVDFDLAIVQQESAVARAELRLLQERAEAEAAVRAWQQLEGERPADALVTRAPQIQDAERSLAAARALLERSRIDRQRTAVTAPFAGRVRSANAEVGQLVQPGQTLAVVHDTAAVEVRLPLPAADVAFLDLPMQAGASDEANRTASVSLTAEFAGERFEWTGRIVRTEGEIDRRTRQLTAVARVEAPYANGEGRPPLLVGMFVQARIAGRTFRDVLAVPRAAVRNGDEVWVVDGERRLRRRTVRVLRTEPDRVILRGGLEPGDLVSITNLETPTEGMLVRRVGDETTGNAPTEVPR